MGSNRGSVVRLVLAYLLGAAALTGWGVRALRPGVAVTPPGPVEARAPLPPPTARGDTLLDEVGRLNGPVPAGEVRAWKAELHAGGPSAGRAAWLHLWLGEVALGQDEQPLA